MSATHPKANRGIVWHRVVAVCIITAIFGPWSSLCNADVLKLEQGLVSTVYGAESIEIGFVLREQVGELLIRVIDGRQQNVFSSSRFDVPAGANVFTWDGRLADGTLILKGMYRVEIVARRYDGFESVSELILQIVPPLRDGDTPRFHPPPFEQPIPKHKINGAVDLRSYGGSFQEGGASARLDADISYSMEQSHLSVHAGTYIASGRQASTRNTSALYRHNFQQGQFQVVYRRPVGEFDDPLRLYADYRSAWDKVGLRATKNWAGGSAKVLGFSGEAPSSSRRPEEGGGLRVFHVFDKIRAGVTYVHHDYNANTQARARNDVAALDVMYDHSVAQQWVMEYAATSLRREDAAGESIGNGMRVAWRYRTESSLDMSVGYLNLGREFAANLSDPGRRIRNDAFGPEGEFRFRSGFGATDRGLLSVALGGADYTRHSDGAEVRDTSVLLTSIWPSGISLSLNAITRNEAGVKDHSARVDSWFPVLPRMRIGIQHAYVGGAAFETRRSYVGLRHDARDWAYDTGIERVARSFGGGRVEEYAWITGGGRANFRFEAALRNTVSDIDDGTNLFVRLAYVERYLRRYDTEYFVEMGDRSTIGTARRIEMGMRMRF